MIKTSFTLTSGRFRIRRLDSRNLIIEQQRPDNGLWVIQGYYGNPRALACGLLDLAADLPADVADDLISQVTSLTATIDRNTAAIIAALAGASGDGGQERDLVEPQAQAKGVADDI